VRHLLLGVLAIAAPRGLTAQVPARIPTLPVTADAAMSDMLNQQRTAARPLPRRLQGATVNRVGPINAVVFSYAYGLRKPALSEAQIAFELLGVVRDTLAQADGVAARLLDASRGSLRLDGSMVFPTLVETSGSQQAIISAFRSKEQMHWLVRRILNPWLNRANLASYDNDGLDGLPSSGDDDGSVDLPIIIIETDSFAASAVVPMDWSVETGPNHNFRTKIQQVYVVALPRESALNPDNLLPTQVVLRALGVTGDLFALGYRTGEIALLPRLQLGWANSMRVVRSGEYRLEPYRPLSIPGLGAPDGVVTWYVEQTGDWVGVTQIIRRTDGQQVVGQTRTIPRGESWSTGLNPMAGVNGPSLQVVWSGAGGLVSVDLRGTP